MPTKPGSGTPNAVLYDNGMFTESDSSGNLGTFGPTGTEVSAISTTGVQVTSGGTALVGQGYPKIIKNSQQNAVTNLAPTAVSFTPPATAGTYRASGYVEVTTGTTISLNVKVTYKSPGTNAVTDQQVWTQQGSATLLAAVVTTGRYYFSETFSIDNSATAIAFADNAGTYTTCVYNLTYLLEQLI